MVFDSLKHCKNLADLYLHQLPFSVAHQYLLGLNHDVHDATLVIASEIDARPQHDAAVDDVDPIQSVLDVSQVALKDDAQPLLSLLLFPSEYALQFQPLVST